MRLWRGRTRSSPSLVSVGTVIGVAFSGNYGGYGFWLPAEGGARSGARRIECVLHSATDAEAPAHSRPRKQQRDAPALLAAADAPAEGSCVEVRRKSSWNFVFFLFFFKVFHIARLLCFGWDWGFGPSPGPVPWASWVLSPSHLCRKGHLCRGHLVPAFINALGRRRHAGHGR